MAHANARTTPHGRRLIVARHQQGWPTAHIAAAMGISRACATRWINRYRTEGDAGLLDRSSRPRSCPRRTPIDVETRVIALRRQFARGRDWIAAETGLPARTVSRVLARHHLPPLSALDPMSGELIRSSKTTAIRYEREHPGDLVHMDVKKLGRIPVGGGWRAHGRAERHSDRKVKIGYDYVHSVVDDHSRMAYCEVLGDEKGTTCAGFLARALDAFAAAGIPVVHRLITDNAWAYKHSLRVVCAERGIVQKFIRPHCPWQNGKVERFNRTLAAEWAYAQVFASNQERTAALAPWLEHYNTARRHSALGGLPPIARLSPT